MANAGRFPGGRLLLRVTRLRYEGAYGGRQDEAGTPGRDQENELTHGKMPRRLGLQCGGCTGSFQGQDEGTPAMNESQTRRKLLVIIGSTRPTRVGRAIGDWFVAHAREAGDWDVTVADLRELDLPMMDEPKHPSLGQYEHAHTKAWSALVAQQDAFVIVMPEYNHSYTAPVKNAIDYLSKEWAYKPVGLLSYGGISAGLRAATALKPVLSALRMVPVTAAVSIPSVSEKVQDGVFVPYDAAISGANSMLEELQRWSGALQPLRAGIG